MISKLFNEIKFVSNDPFVVDRPASQKVSIRNTWNEFISSKTNDDYYDGTVFLVTHIDYYKDQYILTIGESRFSDIVYANRTGNLLVRSLFVASYIVTSDGHYCVIQNKHNRINTIGGMADVQDFHHGLFVPENCLYRELKEELGFDLYDQSVFESYHAKYLKYPVGKENNVPLFPVGILYEINSTLTMASLKRVFEAHRESCDGEIQKLLFFNRDNYLELNKFQNKESYILELLQCATNEKD